MLVQREADCRCWLKLCPSVCPFSRPTFPGRHRAPADEAQNKDSLVNRDTEPPFLVVHFHLHNSSSLPCPPPVYPLCLPMRPPPAASTLFYLLPPTPRHLPADSLIPRRGLLWSLPVLLSAAQCVCVFFCFFFPQGVIRHRGTGAKMNCIPQLLIHLIYLSVNTGVVCFDFTLFSPAIIWMTDVHAPN